MRLRSLSFALALLTATTARAQIAQTWLRDALSPPNPTLHKTPSLAIYPHQTIQVAFSHAQHMKAGVDCDSCHDMVGDSKTTVDRKIPAHPQCQTCHDIEAAKRGEKTDPAAGCNTCHPGMTPPESVPKDVFQVNNIVFSHQSHLKRGTKCEACHGHVDEQTLATRDNLPRMSTCLTCHDGTKAPNRCSECHLTEPDGILKTRFASGVLAPSGTLTDDDHGSDFLKRHAFAAQKNPDSCNTCHRVQECESCHASTSKAFRFHPPEWLQTHPVSSRSQQMDCTACHREQSFCLSCHEASGVSEVAGLRGPGGFIGLKSFHPPGFASPVRNSANHHSFEAMANPESCVGCHSEKDCIKCHATSAVTPPTTANPTQIDPHPPGFASSALACRAFKAAPFACAKCHGAGSGLTSVAGLLTNCR
jgi:hypothetical protein